jgi:hypothetical protein
MGFKIVTFPPESEREIVKQGGKPVMAMCYKRKPNIVFMLVSDDPSGEGGAIERHASVSASTMGVMRQPSDRELSKAAKAAGFSVGECSFHRGKGCIHIYPALKGQQC